MGNTEGDIDVSSDPDNTDTLNGGNSMNFPAQWVLTVYEDDDTGAAQFEFVADDIGGDCQLAGSVIGSSGA